MNENNSVSWRSAVTGELKITIELTPLQAHAFRAARMVGATASKRINELAGQIKELELQTKKLYAESSKLYDSVLEEIAAEHARASIPGNADVSEVDGVVRFSWSSEAEHAENQQPSLELAEQTSEKGSTPPA